MINRSISSTRIDEGMKIYLENVRTFKKWSPNKREIVMRTACEAGDLSVVQYLVKHGVRLPPDALNLTVLTFDCGFELLQYLLAIERWTDEQKADALDVACKLGALQQARYLMNDEVLVAVHHLFSSCCSDNYDLIELVHSSGEWTLEHIQDATCVACFNEERRGSEFFCQSFWNFFWVGAEV